MCIEEYLDKKLAYPRKIWFSVFGIEFEINLISKKMLASISEITILAEADHNFDKAEEKVELLRKIWGSTVEVVQLKSMIRWNRFKLERRHSES
jgi:hypothetical protein